MKRSIWILPVLLAGGFSAIHLLPETGEMASSAIRMELPSRMGDWILQPKPPSQAEINILADDTEFSKAVCLSPRAGEYDSLSGRPIPDRIDLSIVLSGHDLNNSIHRPELCMPAQGHVINASLKQILKLPAGHEVPVMRLSSVQTIPLNQEQTEFRSYQCLTYYFFVGRESITHDHLDRTLIDIKDRLLRGMDQRWAYVSASMWYGKVDWIESEIAVEEADEKLVEFLKAFCSEQIDWELVR